jgi:hypothetical protein
MDLRCVRARKQRHDRERLAGIDGAQDDAHLVSVDELSGSVHRLGRFALGITDDQLDLAPVDAAAALISCTASWTPRLIPIPVEDEGPVSAVDNRSESALLRR